MIDAISGFLIDTVGVGSMTAAIAAPALEGAAVGALGAASMGKNPWVGAGIGGVAGGALGAANNWSALTGGGVPATAADMVDSAGNAITPPIPPGTVPPVDAAANAAAAAAAAAPQTTAALSVDPKTGQLVEGALSGTPQTFNTAGQAVAAGGPLAQQAAAGTRGGGLFGGAQGGLSDTALALGALSLLGSAGQKMKQNAPPTPSSTVQPANWNTPLNTNFPGRTAVNPGLPTGAQPNYWSYGGPEQTYFAGNTLNNFGWNQPGMARGGALNEYNVYKDGRHVDGPGTGTSDSIPARLSDGEYVLTYDDLARLGGGSNERGAQMLDHDRGALAKAVGQRQFAPKSLGHALNERAA